MSRYEGGAAVYDVIRDALRDGMPRTVQEISQATGYSESYVRRWLDQMSDVIHVGSRTRAYRYRLVEVLEMSSRYEGSTAVYDVIRDALRDGMPHTVQEISQATGYSESYVRRWLNQMSDVIHVGSRTRAYRYRLDES